MTFLIFRDLRAANSGIPDWAKRIAMAYPAKLVRGRQYISLIYLTRKSYFSQYIKICQLRVLEGYIGNTL